jgi:3-methyladenine DNA glycosylase AlkD
MSTTEEQIRKQFRKLGDPAIAEHSQRFFKTGKGEYGEGDKFLGIRVPVIRQWAKTHRTISLEEALAILQSPFHEERHLALLILVARYAAADTRGEQAAIYRAYLNHTDDINNWDLVDCSAEHIVGAYLFPRSRKPLYRLARAKNLWRRRIAMMATFHFIKRGDFADTLMLAEKLLTDKEDLIHKAAGWMLREVGKRELAVEEGFLDRHYRKMPRTMLRYAIEKFPENERQAYLRGER